MDGWIGWSLDGVRQRAPYGVNNNLLRLFLYECIHFCLLYLYLENSDNRWQHICEKLHSFLLLLPLCRGRDKGVVGKAGQASIGEGWNPIVGLQSTVGQTIVRQPMEGKGGDGEVWKGCSIVGRRLVKSCSRVVSGIAVWAVGQAVVAGKVFFLKVFILVKCQKKNWQTYLKEREDRIKDGRPEG